MGKEDTTFKFEKVLLIDDNDIDNFINERMITTSHFARQVVVKTSSDAALEYLRKFTGHTQSNPDTLPEVIFLDLNMPVVDGFAFLNEYEKLPEEIKSCCKIVVLSSSISPEDINRASANPYVRRYVNKPLGEKYLEAISF